MLFGQIAFAEIAFAQIVGHHFILMLTVGSGVSKNFKASVKI